MVTTEPVSVTLPVPGWGWVVHFVRVSNVALAVSTCNKPGLLWTLFANMLARRKKRKGYVLYFYHSRDRDLQDAFCVLSIQ